MIPWLSSKSHSTKISKRQGTSLSSSKSSAMNNNNGSVGGSSASTTLVDLQLRLAQPIEIIEISSGNNSDSSLSSSCVSSDMSLDESLVLVLGGCRRCWSYCMVSKKEFPICSNCKQPCLIGFSTDEKDGQRK